MKIYLDGNPFAYDVEQTALALFPGRGPRAAADAPRPFDRTGDYGISRLTYTKRGVTAAFTLCLDGQTVTEICRENLGDSAEEREPEALARHAVRRSVYKAYAALTGEKPAWGALSGVRPAKLARRLMQAGMTPEEAEKRLRRGYYVRDDKARLAVSAAVCAETLSRELDPRDAALYVGIPFCPTRCAYCSFISKTAPSADAEAVVAYLDALRRELAAMGAGAAAAGARIRAVYIGGGTPTFLSAPQLSALMAEIRGDFALAPGCEFTVEAGRPDSLTEDKLRAVAEGGATRVSVNPQSFSNRVLAAIGRSHSAESVYDAFRAVRATGGMEINMDLIAGLPGDTAAGFAQSVSRTLELGPENVTVHTLALKKGSSFAERHQAQLSPQLIADMLSTAHRMLSEAGYAPYYLYRQKYSGGSFENVGWAKEEKICRYNVYMMEELLPVLAAGAGAVTKLSGDGTGRIERLTNPKYPADYCAAIGEILKKKTGLAGLFDGRTKSGETIERNENDEI